MPTPPRRPVWQDSLHDEIESAISPLVQEMKEMRNEINNLRLSAVPRQDVYERQVMDEKLSAIRTEIEATRKEIAAAKEFTWKAVGAVGTILLIIATFAPHIHFG